MQVPKIDVSALQVAERDQRRSELAALAELLGCFRERLLESGFSAREAFTLTERLNEVALWDNAQTAEWGQPDDAE